MVNVILYALIGQHLPCDFHHRICEQKRIDVRSNCQCAREFLLTGIAFSRHNTPKPVTASSKFHKEINILDCVKVFSAPSTLAQET